MMRFLTMLANERRVSVSMHIRTVQQMLSHSDVRSNMIIEATVDLATGAKETEIAAHIGRER